MTLWLITDLDDTWVKTARKLPDTSLCTNVISAASSFEPTYLNPKAFKLWQLFQNINTRIIPVTGRSWASASAWSIDQTMPWQQGGIFSHGACIKDLSGHTDCAWKALVQEKLNDSLTKEALAHWHQLVFKCGWQNNADQRDQRLVALKTEEADVLGWVAKAKSVNAEQRLKEHMDEWKSHALALNLQVFAQKNHITVMPKGISKKDAFAYWKLTYAQDSDSFIGFGDALQDLAFMEMCDWWMTPSGSDISNALQPLNTIK
ncbi:MAG: HAD family hydrolase [Pseudomonadota bacterium]